MTTRTTWIWQFVLVPLAGIFLFPLLWMFSTALKPVDQAMRMPPTWIPKAYYAPLDGVRMRVVPRGTNAVAGVIVATADNRLFVPDADFHAGRVRIIRTLRGAIVTNLVAAQLIKTVPPGFVFVLEDVDQTSMAAQRRWDYVAPALLETRTELAWRNFLAAMRVIPFARYTLNTLILCLLCVVGTTLSNSLVAYGFARVEWPGRIGRPGRIGSPGRIGRPGQ
jgi:ABC-type glycerol-3-phosphate transport system permease component